jgi:hypothetical protein
VAVDPLLLPHLCFLKTSVFFFRVSAMAGASSSSSFCTSSSSSSSSSQGNLPAHGGSCSGRIGHGFVSAASLLQFDGFSPSDTLLSPGFRSAVAMAGWDDESILMAALQPEEDDDGEEDVAAAGGSSSLLANLVVVGEERTAYQSENAEMQQDMSPILVRKLPQIDPIRDVHQRKREQRTPQQAATPASAGRR